MVTGDRIMAWVRWAHSRRWIAALEHDEALPLDRRPPAYAECKGPDDPCCGQCRFSTHGCKDDGPSRAEFVAAGGYSILNPE